MKNLLLQNKNMVSGRLPDTILILKC